jgi:hypothetical protein
MKEKISRSALWKEVAGIPARDAETAIGINRNSISRKIKNEKGELVEVTLTSRMGGLWKRPLEIAVSSKEATLLFVKHWYKIEGEKLDKEDGGKPICLIKDAEAVEILENIREAFSPKNS